MPISMIYKGYYDSVLSVQIDINIDVYAFSNVDIYGAQTLCWYDDLSSQIYNKIKDNKDLISIFNSNKDRFITQINSIGNNGWMSINSRLIVPNKKNNKI